MVLKYGFVFTLVVIGRIYAPCTGLISEQGYI